MAMSNGTLAIVILSAAIATFAIRTQSQQPPPTASNMSQQQSYSTKPGTPKWTRATPDSSFQFVTAAQAEDGNPNPGYSVNSVYPGNVKSEQPGATQPSSVAPQDWPPNQAAEAQAAQQNADLAQNSEDIPNTEDAAMADQTVQPPNVTLNLQDNAQAANPNEFTDQEIMDRMMATMSAPERDNFAMVWLLMSPEEQNNFIAQFRNPQ
jgi:hypothetical protein